MPEMIYVDSSNIQAIGHDPASQELHVLFVNGGTYVYHGVPEFVFQDLLAAPSKGSFLNRVIKGVYSYSKL